MRSKLRKRYFVTGGKDLQPNVGSTDFAADKVIGILMIIFSICGAVAGLAVLGIGGAAAAIGGSAGGADGGSAVAAGGMAMIVGILILAISVARIFAGFKIFGAKRIGFMIGMITSIILIVLNLVQFSVGSIVGIAISVALAGYCWGRMNGKIGPALAD